MAKKLSTLELLKRINEKFPNKFDLTEYLDKLIEYRTKIHVKCNDCGYEFDTTAGLLLQSKHGCMQCYLQNRDKLSKDDVIKKVEEKYGKDRFDFSKFTFNNVRDEGILICNDCGNEFTVKISALTRSKKAELCNTCKKRNYSRLYYDKFKHDVFEKFGDLIDLSKVEYVNAKTKVLLKCNSCGNEFTSTPDSLLHSDYGCPVCAEEMRRKNKSISFKEFIDISNHYHNFKYDYSKVNYIDRYTDVTIICPIHGEFLLKPIYHMRGNGCQECAKEVIAASTRKTSELFIKEAKEIHGEYYNYDKVDYKNRNTPVIIVCPEHGKFELSPEKHLRGHGCQICNRSKGEVLVAKILTDLKIPYKEQQRINVDNDVVIVDFVANGKYVEYNGKLHYEPIEYFGGNERFVLLQNRDESLRKYCKENDILLLEISYKLKPDEVKDLIQKFYEI